MITFTHLLPKLGIKERKAGIRIHRSSMHLRKDGLSERVEPSMGCSQEESRTSRLAGELRRDFKDPAVVDK
jgi:hypothetical protein